MTKQRKFSQIILWSGYLIFGWGILGLVVDQVARSRSLYPFNHGIFLGLGAHVLVGVLAVMTGRSLMSIESRLEHVEGLQNKSKTGADATSS